MQRGLWALVWMVVVLSASSVGAQTVEYSAIDRATVRVFALDGIDMVTLTARRTGSKHPVATAKAGHGSGLLLEREGLIVTAHHVVDGARFIAVKKPGSDEAMPARVVYSSRLSDVAFLAVAGEHVDFMPLPEAAPALKARQTVYALGYPFDSRQADPQSSRGIVSGVRPEGELQLSISVNPGNSGGPVFDESNALIGIITRGADPKKGAQGIGIAVSVEKLLSIHKKGVTPGAVAALRRELAASKPSTLAVTKLVVDFVQQGDLLDDIVKGMDEGSMTKLRREMKAIYDDAQSSPDALSLAAAYYWNEAVAGYVLGEGDWGKPQRFAKALCAKASKQDASIEIRSPFVAAALGRATSAPEYRLSNSGATPETSLANLQDAHGVPKAKAPAASMGFDFGSSPDAAKAACEREGHTFAGEGSSFSCSGPAQEISYTASVELTFCDGKLCGVDLLTKPSKGLSEPWFSRFGAFKKYYEERYGPATTDVLQVPNDCRSRILPCLKTGKAAMRYVWRWPDHDLSVAMGRYRGEPVVKVSHRRK